MRKIAILFFLVMFSFHASFAEDKVSLKKECLETLSVLSDALLNLQISAPGHPDLGAIKCPACNVLHTRAAEAVYPFAVMFKSTGEPEYLAAAISAGEWLIRQQQSEGEWIETPWAWTGTTADQLLMMINAYPIIMDHLSEEQKLRWKRSIKAAAGYIVKYMSPDFASINYCPTSAAALAISYQIIPDSVYLKKAKILARWTVAKMDNAGFIQGEAARSFGVKYGVDLGYEMDMSLWGLGLYARITGDNFVEDAVRKSLSKNLYFVYPTGAINGSWGSRCYKWTTFGSKTADGCQILFSLYARENPQYTTAAMRNLTFLRSMIKDGMIGNGPHFWEIFPEYVCNYPTFARAKNLALACEFGIASVSETPLLPSDLPGWLKMYPTVNVALARSENFMITVSGYGYKDLTSTNGGQYNQHPTGGSVTNVWIRDHGFFQTSSQTKYVRGESMHMPVIEDTVICLTPRVEFRNEYGYFTNLYEFESRMVTSSSGDTIAAISTCGEFKNEQWYQGGVGYRLSYAVFDDHLDKTVAINFHDRQPVVQVVEPIVQDKFTTIKWLTPREVLISGPEKKILFSVINGEFDIELAENADQYRFPFPAMKCFPLVVKISPPDNGYEQTVKFRIRILD